MKTSPLKIVYGALLLLAVSSISDAQTQRLVIPQADISIRPNGTARVKTLCSDYGRMGPIKGRKYSHVLSSDDSIQVVVGGKSMTLQQAIDRRKIVLRTPLPTIEDIIAQEQSFERLDPSARQYRASVLLKLLSPSEQQHALAQMQNPSSLEIVNISGEHIEFHAKNAALGTVDESAPSIPTSADSQSHLWISQMQQGLVAEGFNVDVDGKLGPQTRDAVRAFQRQFGLKQTGTATVETAAKLREVGDDRWLRSQTSDDLTVLRIENRPQSTSRYRVVDSDGKVVFSGNDLRKLIDSIAAVPTSNGSTKYLDLDNFSQTQTDNLATSFSTYRDIKAIPRPDGSRFDRDVFFSKGIRLERVEEPIAVTSGPKTGWFKAVLHFFVKFGASSRNVTVELFSRTKERLAEFLAGANSNPDAGTIDMDRSIALFVAQGRRHLVSKFGSADDVDVLITTTQSRKLVAEVELIHANGL